MTTTPIEWTDVTWNPTRGCARVSPGCEHCYAERVAHRFGGEGQPYAGLTVLGKHGPRWSGRARFVPEMLGEPLRWRKPRRVFVDSMSDLFHEDITNEQIAAVFGVMAACPQHTFQLLTKRPERMREWFEWADGDHMRLAGIADEYMTSTRVAHRLYHHFDDEMGETDLAWPLPNVWIGVSVEDQQRADERIPLLLQTPAAVRFVSAEPLLGPIDFDIDAERAGHANLYRVDALTGRHRDMGRPCRDTVRIDWVIVGGESGPGARRCEPAWIRSIVRQCSSASVSCFVKQLGSHGLMGYGKGGDMADWPADLQLREYPRGPA